MNYESFDGIFVLSAASLVAGLLAASIRLCYKSKCQNISCCYGLFEIHRDTEGEEAIDIELAHNHHHNDGESTRDIIPNSI
jgi:hypothetical protein